MKLPTKITLNTLKDWTWEQYVSYGQMVRALKDASQWALGDMARGIEKAYGDNAIGKFAKEIGINEKSLIEYRRVASQYPLKRHRMSFLSFSHHQRALKAEEPLEVLKMAHDNEWSIRQLDRYLIEERSADCEHDWKDFKICKECGKKTPLTKQVE